MQDFNKNRLVFHNDKKRAIPWLKILIGIIAVVVVVLILSLFQSEPQPVSIEIDLPKLN
jgi:hypothetical protein